MKISLNWLNDYVEIGQDAENCAQILSDLGFPTEGIERFDDDTVIDIEVTSNRGDCLSHIGVAREIAAVLGKPLNIPEVKLPQLDKAAMDFVGVVIESPDVCKRCGS